MPQQARKALAGSARQPLAGARHVGAVDPNESLRVTVVLRRRGGAQPRPQPCAPMSREAHAAAYGSDPADVAALEAFARDYGLRVAEHNPERRTLQLWGSAQDMQRAFGTELHHYELDGRRLRCRSGALTLPADLQPRVAAVLGLDNRPVARPHFRRSPRASADAAFTPPQLAQLYAFPSGLTGSGQAIALIELGGGYQPDDLQAYFAGLGLADPPKVVAVGVDGGSNQPGGDADGEVMLDIEVAGSIAPGAAIAVYFAPNTDQGFHDAIAQAAHDTVNRPGIISISWGGAEDGWTAQARDAMNAALQDAAALGITVTVACGDSGATDGAADGALHVDFPAASPYVLACGGTRVQASGTAIASEDVWNELASNDGATGGGVSTVFALPDYQKGAGVPQARGGFAGRGVPDVAGDADPLTGYKVRVDGQDSVIGGTSAVAPLWAALVALLNQRFGKPLGFVNPLLYKLGSAGFRDIVSGGNGGYDAAAGWDACTGWGSPNGGALAQRLGAQIGT